jgi:hypothetical protein
VHELPLPAAIPLERGEEGGHLLRRRAQQVAAASPERVLGAEAIQLLGAAVPEGDAVREVPGEDRLVRLLDQLRAQPQRRLGALALGDVAGDGRGPTTAPVASRTGEIVTDTARRLPSLRTRTVS